MWVTLFRYYIFYIIEVYLWYFLNACVITHFKTDGCVSSSVLFINSFNTQ